MKTAKVTERTTERPPKTKTNGRLPEDTDLTVRLTEEEQWFITHLLDMAWNGGIKDERAGLTGLGVRAKIPKPGTDRTPFDEAFVEALKLKVAPTNTEEETG